MKRIARRRCTIAAALIGCLAGTFAGSAAATPTSYDRDGTILVGGAKVFPIVLTLPPPLGGMTPSGRDGLDEVASAGVNFVRAGPIRTTPADAIVADAQAWNRAAAARGIHTWVYLRELALAQPGTPEDAMLRSVVAALKNDRGLGLWKGADEPRWMGWAPSLLHYAYCLTTSRGDPSWCDTSRSLDPSHLWVTIQAPVGSASDLAPYSAVTDIHGVDPYPIAVGVSNPDLHHVGRWTEAVASVTPNRAVWTTLQICFSGSSDASGRFVLPTWAQERYMAYDAIINGARALNFFGGANPRCWTAADAARGWNWSFWNAVLRPLIVEIGPRSPLYPALLHPATAVSMTATDATTQVTSRAGTGETWVLAARHGEGEAEVTLSGLPPSTTTGTVYTEGRSVAVRDGAFTDHFAKWDVHVYRFDTEPPRTRALASSGRSGHVAKLRYRVSDNSGEARERLQVFEGRRVVRMLGTRFRPVGPGRTYSVGWRVPATTIGPLRFCVRASDRAGNASADVCAPLRVTR